MSSFILQIRKIRQWPQYQRSVLGSVVILMLILGISAGRKTYSYFTDDERSLGNILGASSLDIALSDPLFSPEITPEDDSESDFQIDDEDSIIFKYIITFQSFSGDSDFCENLELKAFLNGSSSPSYDGPLESFSFTASDTDPLKWKFEASLVGSDPDFQNKECLFDIEVKAWQKNMSQYPDGYSDFETVPTKIESGYWGPSVIINELMWPGSYRDTNDEWIELRNMTDEDIDLSGWKIINGAGGSSDLAHIIIPTLSTDPYTIEAGGYFLLLANEYDDTAIDLPTDLDHDEGYTDVSEMNLHNGGEELVLQDAEGNIIDTAWKDDDWPDGYLGQGNDHIRQSMQRNDPPGDGTSESDWNTCDNKDCLNYWDSPNTNNYGTPGEDNL